MPALVAGIHVLDLSQNKTWMAGTKPGRDKLMLQTHLSLALHAHAEQNRGRVTGEVGWVAICQSWRTVAFNCHSRVSL